MKRKSPPPEELNTIQSLRKLITKMQTGGLVFLLVGVFLPQISPFYAEKSWKLLLGPRVSLQNALIAFGCLMLIVSIVAFLRSYRCPKCGALIGMTPYVPPKACRGCGVKLKDTDRLKQG